MLPEDRPVFISKVPLFCIFSLQIFLSAQGLKQTDDMSAVWIVTECADHHCGPVPPGVKRSSSPGQSDLALTIGPLTVSSIRMILFTLINIFQVLVLT